MNIPIRGKHHTEDGVSPSIKAAAQAGGRGECYPSEKWGFERKVLDMIHHETEYTPVTTYRGDDLERLGYNGV